MIKIIKKLIRKTPLYHPMLHAIEISGWVKDGRPMPPPHVIKQRVLLNYAKRYGLSILVETGTYRGGMVEAMRTRFHRIYSIELSRELYEQAVIRFEGSNNIELFHGDSAVELEHVVNSLNQPALFWLDGHYSGAATARGTSDTPVFEELNQIFSSKQKGHVIIIDDARCFGVNPGYPTIDELIAYVKSLRQDVDIAVDLDSIRITPKR